MDTEEHLTDGAILKDKNEKMEYIYVIIVKKIINITFFIKTTCNQFNFDVLYLSKLILH